jgi:perosamine synthetase
MPAPTRLVQAPAGPGMREPPKRRGAMRIPGHPVLSWGSAHSAAAGIPHMLDGQGFVLTRSARSAIGLALSSSGIGAGRRVLVPNYYCPTMLAPIERCGAAPVFYPITSRGLPDLQWLNSHTLSDCGALLAVHFFGLPVDFSAVRQFCDRLGILMIEDCAHSFFGVSNGVPVGGLGDYSVASLPKFFPVLEGGVLASRSRDLSCIHLSPSSWASELKAVWNLLEASALHSRLPGINTPLLLLSRLLALRRVREGAEIRTDSPLQVSNEAVRTQALDDPLLVPAGLRRTERFILDRTTPERIIGNRRRNYQLLVDGLRNCLGVEILFPELPEGAAPYVLAVRVQMPDPIYAYLKAMRLPVLRWDRYWPGAIDTVADVGRDWGHHVVQVLCHQDLTTSDIEAVISGFRGCSNQPESVLTEYVAN